MSDTPFSVTVQEFGSGKFVLSGDINATARLHGSGYYDLTGDIVGTLTMFGAGYARLIGTISGLFTGAIDATITFFGVGKAIVTGTIGSSALSGTISIFGTGQATLVGSVASSGPPAPTITSIDVASGYNSITTNIVISGADFVSGATAKLGITSLINIVFVDSTTLTATIPSGMTAGVYALTVTNPDVQVGSLPNAFTVIQAPVPTAGTRIILDSFPIDGALVATESPALPYSIYAVGNTFSVSGGVLSLTGAPGSNNSLAIVNTGQTDKLAIQAHVDTSAGTASTATGISFRAAADGSSFITFVMSNAALPTQSSLALFTSDYSTINVAAYNTSNTGTLRVELDGNNIKCFLGSALIFDVTNSFNNDKTWAGVYDDYSNTPGVWSNFKTETLIPFTPLALPAMPAWWKADAITGFNDGDSLTSWVDSSGNGNNLGLGGLSTIAPIYHTNVQNGLPGVTFADVPATSLYTTGVTMTNPFSIFVVYSYDGAISGAHRAVHGEGTNWLIGPYNGSSQAFGGGGFAANPPAVVQNAFVYQTVVQIVGNLDNYVNGTYRGSVVPNTAPNNVTVGAYGGETLGGRVLEVIPVNWAADSYLRGLVEGYLVAKLGL